MWSLFLVMSECSLSGRGQGHVSNFYIVDLENFATAYLKKRCRWQLFATPVRRKRGSWHPWVFSCRTATPWELPATTLCVCQQSVQLHAGEMPAISAERTSTAANSRRRQLFLSGGVTCRPYGYEEEHLALRLMCALQVGLNASSYDGTSPQRHQLLRQGLVVCPEYFKVRTSNRRLWKLLCVNHSCQFRAGVRSRQLLTAGLVRHLGTVVDHHQRTTDRLWRPQDNHHVVDNGRGAGDRLGAHQSLCAARWWTPSQRTRAAKVSACVCALSVVLSSRQLLFSFSTQPTVHFINITGDSL